MSSTGPQVEFGYESDEEPEGEDDDEESDEEFDDTSSTGEAEHNGKASPAKRTLVCGYILF